MVSTDVLPNVGLTWNIFSIMFQKNFIIFRVIYATSLLFVMIVTFIRFSTARGGCTPQVKERYMILMMASLLLFQSYPTVLDFSLVLSLIVSAEEPRFVNTLIGWFATVMFGTMIVVSSMGVLMLERNTGSPSFLFNTSAAVIIAGALAIVQSLKLARMDGYIVKSATSESVELKKMK